MLDPSGAFARRPIYSLFRRPAIVMRWAGGLVFLLAGACGDGRPDVGAHLATSAADLVATPVTRPPAGPGVAADSALAAGLEVYREQYCGTCHTFAVAGTGGIFGPPHDDLASMAQERIHDAGYTGRATTASEYVLESLIEPGLYRVPGFERTRFLMPAYTNLTEPQLQSLVQLLLHTPSAVDR